MSINQTHTTMKNFIKPILIASGILFFTSCGESPSVKKSVDLQPEEKQAVLTMSGQFNTLLRQKATLAFIKTAMLQTDKASFMMDYLSPSFNNEQNKIAKDIIGHLFNNKRSESLREKTDDDFFSLSPTVSELTKKLTNDMKGAMVTSLNDGQSTDQLTNSLKSVITNFKEVVKGNSSLTFDESRALVAFAEFENSSIADIIGMANSLNTNSGGRTQGWFSDLISVVVTAVVAAVVVVAVVVTAGAAAGVLGAAWFGTAVAVGAIAGGVYGGVVGYDLRSRGYYFDDFDPTNIGGGFLDWDRCTNNPGHWACI
jgi:hypothetical protein